MRVEFTKNRQKRSRSADLSQKIQAGDEAVDDLATSERLSGKGALTRYRTLLTTGEGNSNVVRSVDLETTTHGRVLKSIGANNVTVQLDNGRTLNCSVRRVVQTLARDGRNAVVAGDRVLLTEIDPQQGVIEWVEPRQRSLTRVSRGAAHVIVANVDQAVIVASVNDPPLKPGLIDRFLCSTEKGGIHGILCINKIDLGDRVRLMRLVGLYTQLGYEVVLTNALTGEGIDELQRLLAGKETVFTGQSGVGKSSLLNAVQPGLGQEIGGVSSDTHKGRHTTRVTELIALDGGGWVVDTPGIRQLELWDVQPEEVEDLFVEFRPFVPHCRFPDCSHLHENDCRVKAAVQAGWISSRRYQSYCRLVLNENKHRRQPSTMFDDEPDFDM